MEEVDELIKHYGLEENAEYVIIPFYDKKGSANRCFLLKRKFIRIAYPQGYNIDYPLSEAIEAVVKYPELPLSESLHLLHKESDAQKSELSDKSKENLSN